MVEFFRVERFRIEYFLKFLQMIRDSVRNLLLFSGFVQDEQFFSMFLDKFIVISMNFFVFLIIVLNCIYLLRFFQ